MFIFVFRYIFQPMLWLDFGGALSKLPPLHQDLVLRNSVARMTFMSFSILSVGVCFFNQLKSYNRAGIISCVAICCR